MRASRAPTASQIQVLEGGLLGCGLMCCGANHQVSRTRHRRRQPQNQAAFLAGEDLVSCDPLARREAICSRTLTGGLGHALRRNAAGAFGPDLAKKLSQLVKMEKNVMRSLELVAKERMEVAVCGSRPHPRVSAAS